MSLGQPVSLANNSFYKLSLQLCCYPLLISLSRGGAIGNYSIRGLTVISLHNPLFKLTRALSETTHHVLNKWGGQEHSLTHSPDGQKANWTIDFAQVTINEEHV